MTILVLLTPILAPLAAAGVYAAAGWQARTTAWAGVATTALLERPQLVFHSFVV